MSIIQKIEDLASQLELFDDALQKYEYIIELGQELPVLDRRYQMETYLVPGCQSPLWLHLYLHEGRVCFDAHSEALIVRGLVRIVQMIYSGERAEAILASGPQELQRLGLLDIITPGRQNGVASVVKKVFVFAKEVNDAK